MMSKKAIKEQKIELVKSLKRQIDKINPINDIDVLKQIYSLIQDKHKSFFEAKGRYDNRVNFLLSILVLVNSIAIAFTFYIFDNKVINKYISIPFVLYSIGIILLIGTLVMLVIKSRYRGNYIDLSNDFLISKGTQPEKEYIKSIIAAMTVSSNNNLHLLEKLKGKLRCVHFFIVVSLILIIAAGGLIIYIFPDKILSP